jgi:hypothetical protein
METFIVRVKSKSKVKLAEKLLKSFDFLEVSKEKNFKPFTPKEKKIIKGFKEAFADIDLNLKGKKKLKTLQELIDELQDTSDR